MDYTRAIFKIYVIRRRISIFFNNSILFDTESDKGAFEFRPVTLAIVQYRHGQSADFGSGYVGKGTSINVRVGWGV